MAKKEPLSGKLFKKLACPLCKANLDYTKDNKKLVCKVCREKFDIKNNIPVLKKK